MVTLTPIDDEEVGSLSLSAMQSQQEPAQEQPSVGMDVLQSISTGLRVGMEMLGGAFGDVSDINSDIASWLAGKVGASPETAQTIGEGARYLSPGFGISPRTAEAQKATSALVGEHYEPQTTLGEYSKTGAEFLPAAAIGPGRLGGRLITQALLPALGSETAGQLTEGEGVEPYARIAGALLGGMAPAALRRVVTPFPSSPNREALVRTLADEGVDVTAGQRTGSERLRYAESELGGRGAANISEQQAEQFTRAALRRAGIDAPRATPEVIDTAFTQIGQQFDDLAARNRIVADQQLGRDLRDTINEYGNLVPESQRAPIIENLTNDIVDSVRRNRGIAGDTYQSLRSRIDRAARGSRDPELGQALRGLRNSLDDAMERSIAANNPDDAGAWREVRNQYRNMLVLEKAATGAGENAAAGLISPSQLRNATVQGQGRRNYARGQGDFAELARAGEGVMKPLPNSGTAGRLNAQNMGTSVLSLLGAGGGAAAGGPVGAAAGMLAGAAIPRVAGAAMMSRPGQAFLGNQLLAGGEYMDPRTAAVIAALLGSSEQRALPPSQ